MVLTKEKQQEVYSRSSPLLSVTNVANENVNSEKQNRRTKITILLSAQRFHRDGEGRKNIFAASQKSGRKVDPSQTDAADAPVFRKSLLESEKIT